MNLLSILHTLILYPLELLIEISYMIFHKLFETPGISVIGVSLTVTLLCLPLYIVAEHWQQVERETQKKLSPVIQHIKSTFSGDERYMMTTAYYRENNYHPMMALRSSFGLLIQIPFFMAAYNCLSNLPALNGESFLFIRDLGQQDALFKIGSFPINVLPIAMTLINCIAGAIYTKGFSLREKIQIYGMALLFLVILYNSPSGLVLYWTMNNVFSLIKNIFYKFKNPLKVLYFVFSALCFATIIYIVFIYDGGASLTKRIAASIPLAIVFFIPLLKKLFYWTLRNPLHNLLENKSQRHLLYILSTVSITILLGIVIPSSVISSSPTEFSNVGKYASPNQLIMNPFWQAAGIFIFWLSSIYLLYRKQGGVQTFIAFFSVFALVSFLTNTFFFAGNYGSMDLTLKFSDKIASQPFSFIIINLVLNILIFLALILLLKLKKIKIIQSILVVSIFTLCGISAVNIFNTKKVYSNLSEIQNLYQKNGNSSFSLSQKEKNVVVFMMDRAESAYFKHFLKDFPSIATSYDGFTFYPNTVAFNGHTLIGAPALYGGYEYVPVEINKRDKELLKDKHNESLLVLPRIFTEQGNLDSTVIDLSWGNYNIQSDLSFIREKYPEIQTLKFTGKFTGHFKKEYAKFFDEIISLDMALERNLLFVSLFRSTPALVRPAIYYDGSWWSQNTKAEDLDTVIDSYSVLYYLNDCTKFDSEKKGSLVIITNETTHTDDDIRFLNILDGTSDDMEASYVNYAASLNLIAKWIENLKQNGAYDNTKIIIVADHGIGYGKHAKENYKTPELENGVPKDHFNPLLLVKDFDAHGNIEIDNSFMTTADVPTIAVKDIVQDAYNPFTNKKISSESKKNGVYVTTDSIFMPHHSKSKYVFTASDDSWFHINENIFDDINWRQTLPQ